VIDFSIVVSSLPLIVKVSVETSGDGENCTMGGKVVGLLWRLADLLWRWVGFCLVLLICVV
jgi:hypothetical protein